MWKRNCSDLWLKISPVQLNQQFISFYRIFKSCDEVERPTFKRTYTLSYWKNSTFARCSSHKKIFFLPLYQFWFIVNELFHTIDISSWICIIEFKILRRHGEVGRYPAFQLGGPESIPIEVRDFRLDPGTRCVSFIYVLSCVVSGGGSHSLLTIASTRCRPRWSRGYHTRHGSEVRGFKPSRGRWFFRA